VDYKRVGNTPEDPHHHWVLSQITEDDGIAENGGPTTATYEFSDGVWDFGGMRSLPI
jgi:hypothetical protein